MKKLLLCGVAACALGGCAGIPNGHDLGTERDPNVQAARVRYQQEWDAAAPIRASQQAFEEAKRAEQARQFNIKRQEAQAARAKIEQEADVSLAKSGQFRCYHGTNGSWIGVRSDAECRDWQGRMNAAAMSCLDAGAIPTECLSVVTPPVVNLPGRSYGR